MNETVLTVIGLLFLFAAMGKSAQLGLHSWLPDAMEGWLYISIITLVIPTCLMIAFMTVQDTHGYATMSASVPPLLLSLPRKTLEVFTGNILGDGSVRYPNFSRDRKASGNARYEMTMSAAAYGYVMSLYETVYAQYSSSGILPFPNLLLPIHAGKSVTQYYIATRSLPIFTALHTLWYRWDATLDKFVKISPECFPDMLGPVALAHWIMEDGYFDSYGRSQTIILCTECFTKVECLLLIEALAKLGIYSTLKVRSSEKGTYRIRISKTSMPLVRELMTRHMHQSFMYKLGA